MKLLTLEIELLGTIKKIKRKLQITDDFNLNALHIALQEMFYFNYDLHHEFEFNNNVYLPKNEYNFTELEEMQSLIKKEMDILKEKGVDTSNIYETPKKYYDDCTTKLKMLNMQFGDVLEYLYDEENNYCITLKLIQTNPAKTSKINLFEIKGKFVPQGLDIDEYNKIKEKKEGKQFAELVAMENEFDAKMITHNVSMLTADQTLYN